MLVPQREILCRNAAGVAAVEAQRSEKIGGKEQDAGQTELSLRLRQWLLLKFALDFKAYP